MWRLRPLLPNEPRLHLPAAEPALTERHLLPALPALETFFLAVRRQLDPELERLQPVKLGKPYPLEAQGHDPATSRHSRKE